MEVNIKKNSKLDLNLSVKHGDAKIKKIHDSLEVITMSQLWSYAISFNIDKSFVNKYENQKLKITATLKVQNGRIGVGVLNKEKTKFICEQAIALSTNQENIIFEIFNINDISDLVFRNIDINNTRSSFRLYEITCELIDDNKVGHPDHRDKKWNDSPFDLLREKWCQVPGDSQKRIHSSALLEMNDGQLIEYWKNNYIEQSEGFNYSNCRGWYQDLYEDFVRDKRILDVGSGLGYSSINFAKQGAHVTFFDLHQDNLKIIKRLCNVFGITKNTTFYYLDNYASFNQLPYNYDIIFACGSLLCAPFDVAKKETQLLLEHLKIGGRWLELAYPKQRWLQEGSLPFDQWGIITDGENTPWMEWYDVEKKLRIFEPAKLDLLYYYEWNNNTFNWFDFKLRKR